MVSAICVRVPQLLESLSFYEAPTLIRENAGSAKDGPTLDVGDRVGASYIVYRVIGQGAAGTVYEGLHSELRTRVAIKVLHQPLASDAELRSRFEREAKVLGALRGLHAPRVRDVGELPDGSAYIVMDLLTGPTLEARIMEGALPFGEVIEVGRQLLSALRAIHAQRVVHRDIKPSNIILDTEEDWSTGTGGTFGATVKLIDFGICQPNIEVAIEPRITNPGMVVGTPGYMPPEQLSSADVDERADLYSGGIVLYECITGRVPFEGNSWSAIVVAVLQNDVPSIRSLRPDCPIELELFIMRSMDRNPQARFQTAEEMLESLEHVAAALGFPSSPGLDESTIEEQPIELTEYTEPFPLLRQTTHEEAPQRISRWLVRAKS